MGDRANFGFKQGEDTIYLYGHWAGQNMMAKLAKALNRVLEAGRINDPAYATRICISDLTADSHATDLGWGITVNSISDNEHSVPVVNFENETVSLYDFDYGYNLLTTTPKVTFSVGNFIRKYGKVLV